MKEREGGSKKYASSDRMLAWNRRSDTFGIRKFMQWHLFQGSCIRVEECWQKIHAANYRIKDAAVTAARQWVTQLDIIENHFRLPAGH